MLPIQYLYFNSLSIIAPLCNLIYVPLFSYLIMPSILLGLIFSLLNFFNYSFWHFVSTLLNYIESSWLEIAKYEKLIWLEINNINFAYMYLAFVIISFFPFLKLRIILYINFFFVIWCINLILMQN